MSRSRLALRGLTSFVLMAVLAPLGARADGTFPIANGRDVRLAAGEAWFVVSWVTDDDPAEIHGRRFVDGAFGPEYAISQFEQWEHVLNWDLDVLDDERQLSHWSADCGCGPLAEGDDGDALPEGDRRRLLTAEGMPLSDEAFSWSWLAAALGGGTYARFGKRWNAEGEEEGLGMILDGRDQPVSEAFHFTGGPTPGLIGFWLQDARAIGDGGVIVLWTQPLDPDTNQLFAQVFDAGGLPLAAQQLLEQGHVYSAGVTLSTAGLPLAAWAVDGAILTQKLDALGAPVGVPQPIHQAEATTSAPGVACEASVCLAVWWQHYSHPGDTSSAVWARRLTGLGAPSGAAFRLSGEGTGVGSPQLARLGDGRFVVTWTEYPEDSHLVVGRFVEAALFADGFESGDTSAWSDTVP